MGNVFGGSEYNIRACYVNEKDFCQHSDIHGFGCGTEYIFRKLENLGKSDERISLFDPARPKRNCELVFSYGKCYEFKVEEIYPALINTERIIKTCREIN